MLFKKHKYKKWAADLENVSRLGAISILVPLLDQFPVLRGIFVTDKSRDWDFFTSTAIVGLAVSLIPKQRKASDHLLIDKALKQQLTRDNVNGHEALMDWVKYVTQAFEKGIDLNMASGMWVLMNVKGGTDLQPAEIEAARTLGLVCMKYASECNL